MRYALLLLLSFLLAFLLASVQPASAQAPLAHFHDALRASSERPVRVLVYGASHTASDQFTGVLRTRLQERFGNGGVGFVVPGRPFSAYRHRYVEMSTRGGFDARLIRGRSRDPGVFGLAGFAVRARSWARSTMSLREDQRFDRARIYVQRGGAFSVFIDGERERHVANRGRGLGYIDVQVSGHTLELRATRAPVTFYGVAFSRGTAGLTLDAFGVPGARARDQLLWNWQAQRAHLQKRSYALIALAYGTNESGDRGPIARYRERLSRVLMRLRQSTPDASCLLIGPGEFPRRRRDGTREPRARTRDIVETQRQVASEQGCGFFDTLAFVGGEGAMARWVAEGLAFDDHVHFTNAGHQRLGSALYEMLVSGYSDTQSP